MDDALRRPCIGARASPSTTVLHSTPTDRLWICIAYEQHLPEALHKPISEPTAKRPSHIASPAWEVSPLYLDARKYSALEVRGRLPFEQRPPLHELAQRITGKAYPPETSPEHDYRLTQEDTLPSEHVSNHREAPPSELDEKVESTQPHKRHQFRKALACLGCLGASKSTKESEEVITPLEEVTTPIKFISPVDLARMRRELEDRVHPTLFQCLVDHGKPIIGLNEDAKEDLSDPLTQIQSGFFNIVKPDDAHQSGLPAIRAFCIQDLQVYHDGIVRSLLQNFEKAGTILEKSQNYQSKQVSEKALEIMYHLNDSLVEVIVALEREGLISEQHIREILNEQNNVRLISNWILGEHTVLSHEEVMYATFDLKLSIESNPSTHLIHGLVKHLDQNSWRSIERWHLDAELAEFNRCGYKLHDFAHEFLVITSPAKGLVDHAIQSNILKFSAHLVDMLFVQLTKLEYSMYSLVVKSKVLYSMLRFIVQYDVKPSRLSHQYMGEIRSLPDFPKIQALERLMMVYSDLIQTAYLRIATVLETLTLDADSYKVYHTQLYNTRYLVDMDKREQRLLFSAEGEKTTTAEEEEYMTDEEEEPTTPDLRTSVLSKSANAFGEPFYQLKGHMPEKVNLDMKSLGLGSSPPKLLSLLGSKIQDISNEIERLRSVRAGQGKTAGEWEIEGLTRIIRAYVGPDSS
ncbi:hypothetical protein H4Q26_002218 [Puccinia striiformis f. sp. tritici PST-130]|nr:hypothetical protein H4Q26_002218 [Puccinia striiformis f. sp. tritici PST-130]